MYGKPNVSVVMSFYNESVNYIEQAIQSILTQTYKNFEFIIICDNPNNLPVINYVKALDDNRIIFLENETNKGLVYSLNIGIKYSRGEYIIRMDSDDISYKERIEKQLNYLESNKNIDLLGTEVDIIDENNNILNTKIINRSKKPKNLKKISKYGNIFIHPSLIIRKTALEEIGFYRDVKYAEDYDLILRMINKNMGLAIMNEKLLKYRIRKEGISRSNIQKQLITTEYIRKLYKRNKLDSFDSNINEELVNNPLSIFNRISILKNQLITVFLVKTLK